MMRPHVLLTTAFTLMATTSLRAQDLPAAFVNVPGQRSDVVLQSGRGGDPVRESQRVSMLIEGCRRQLVIDSDDSTAAMRVAPTPMPTDPARDGETIIITVLPAQPVQVRCPDRLTQSTIAAARGLRIAFDTSYFDTRDVRRATLLRDGVAVATLFEEHEAVWRVSVQGLGVSRARLHRFVVPLDAIAPGANGRQDDLAVEIRHADSSVVERVTLPWESVREVWLPHLAARATAAQARARAAAPLRLPEPRDEVLHRADEAYRSGDLATAVVLATARAPLGVIPDDERRLARMESGLALLALGDSAAARIPLSLALERDPCLTLDATAPAGVRAAFDALARPSVRCAAQRPLRTLVRGALTPGFGRPDAGEKPLRGVVTVAAITGLAGGAILSGMQGRSAHEDYLAYRIVPTVAPPSPGAAELWDRADASRRRGAMLWQATAVAWGAAVAYDVLRESRYARALAQVSGYGGEARAQLAPTLAPALVPLAGPAAFGVGLRVRGGAR